MAAITCDPSCFELFDDGTNEPESDVSCTSLSAAVAADGSQCAFFAHTASTGASCCCKHYYKHYKIKQYIKYNKH